ncbi:MAG TPA: ABC transporter permease [Alphaproteobacteria bacterium]|nr:ABC transporter permease [Alphaproteobacteria bacterium]
MRPALICVALGLAALALSVLSLFIGYAPIPPEAVIAGLLGEGDTASIVVREIRLPRALLALMIGAALGASGAALQGLLRNPLAEPGVIGISAAAGLGAVGAMYFGLASLWPWALPALAMLAAALATVVLLLVSWRGGTLSLILAGVALSSICAALTSLALNLSPNAYAASEIIYWLLGSLKDRSMADAALAAPFVGLGAILIFSQRKALDVLALGEETAVSLGVDLRALSVVLVLGVAMAAGASVAAAGAIGFIGLVVPHIMRPFVGHAPSALMLPSALGGACLLLAADMCVRVIPTSSELMVGVLTALLGAPFFFWLVLRHRRAWS